MFDIFRESTVGELLNRVSGGRILPYPDQRPDFVIPERYLVTSSPSSASSSAPITRVPSEATSWAKDTEKAATQENDATYTPTAPTTPDLAHVKSTGIDVEKAETMASESDATLEAAPKVPIEKVVPDTKGYQLVEWYGDEDPENPRNWTFRKRAFVSFQVCLLTFSIYIGSAIYTASIPYVTEEFQVSNVVATLGLSLFIWGYAIGPMIFSPLQELPSLGRNPVYIITLALFAIFQIPTALSTNISGLLVLRFIAGVLGSPALATGGASLGDIFSQASVPFAIGLWAMAAIAGPVVGPIIGGFAAAANGWRWPIWELAWISGFGAIFFSLLLPETLPDTILLKRAQRLRKLTGNENLRSESEIRQSEMSAGAAAKEYLVRPFQLMMEPAVMFVNLYLALAYSIFYLWFEAFPLVFVDIYHFTGGISGLPFIGILVGTMLSFVFYVFYLKYYLFRRFARLASQNIAPQPEEFIRLALLGGTMIPVSLLIFGWTARPDGSVHWIWPIIGAGAYMPGIYLLLQSIYVYLPVSYPSYVASIFAGGGLVRGVVAAAFPLFGKDFFNGLGIGPGSSLLAGVAALMLPLLWALMTYGSRLRAKSNYAQ